MPLTIHRPSKCAICTFEVAEWLVPSLASPRGKRFFTNISTFPSTRTVDNQACTRSNGPIVQYSKIFERLSSSSTKITRVPSIPPSISNAPYKDIILGHRSLFENSKGSDIPKVQSGQPKGRRVRKGRESPPRTKSKYAIFEGLVLEQLAQVIRQDLNWSRSATRDLANGWGIMSQLDLQVKLRKYKGQISKSFEMAEKHGLVDQATNPIYYLLRTAFVRGDVRGLNREVKHSFLSSTIALKHSPEEVASHKKIADLMHPTEWYPATRAMQRTIHLHVGPTNSGKTYHALQRLEAAETGVYAGPLRLLAHEVYTRFNAKGKACALITGEERRFPEGLKFAMSSCTVEMVPLNTKVDVAVIDEIQMMGDLERGWAWTQAFLGVQAKEVHLCGELRTVPLIQELCALMGEKLEIHRYERLSPLQTQRHSVKSLRDLKQGDAVIVFSRKGIHAMKNEIEAATQKRCAIVYGSLPPETRAQQASFFNDPDNNYDYLVASDAIGMGLNLAIKRVIFESTSKSNGSGGFKVLEDYEIKQIGGRAGRYKTAQDATKGALVDGKEPEANGSQLPVPDAQQRKVGNTVGFVTTLEQFDLDVVSKAMAQEVKPLKAAGIFPPSSIIHQFATYFPADTPFSWIILRLHELASLSPRFQLCYLKDQVSVADVIQPYKLTIQDRLIFMASPAVLRDPGMPDVVREFAQCVAENSGGELLSIKSLYFEILDTDMEEYLGGVNEYLRQVETLHKALTLYLWLSYRFAGVFRSQALAFHAKSLVEERIDQCLNAVHWDSSMRARQAKGREKFLAKQLEQTGEETLGGIKLDESGQIVDSGDEKDGIATEAEEVKDGDEVEDEESAGSTLDEAERLQDVSAPSEVALDGALGDASGLPANEVARVIESVPPWEKASQQSHDRGS